ncbi:MAG: glycerophosphoryl diester phosphodiesterase membrane domain-containing protein, partial [Candidatus Nanohaloarchaea archaeon]|nr:glycerophosphoryl diester phosphodiesterase membrane domain-containing protein [Candidatus Nanohaloarchaea archaeon]
MVLEIGKAVEEGFRRTFKRNGLMLVGAFFLLNLASAFTGMRSGATFSARYSMTNPAVAAFVVIAVSLFSVAVSIAALRVFVSDETETVPEDLLKRNIGSAVLHTIGGGVALAVGMLVVVGVAFLPLLATYMMGATMGALGILLSTVIAVVAAVAIGYVVVSLFFWVIIVAVEDQSFWEAMKSSWEITKGNKWRILGLILVI